MSKKLDDIDPLEEELKSFIEKLNSENEALSKILSGVIEVRAPDLKKSKNNDGHRKENDKS